MSEDFKNVQFCTDSLGIRSRKERVRELISAHVADGSKNGRQRDQLTLLSVGCGTALPILEVARALRDQGIRPTVILLDQDPIALAAAQCLAQRPEFDMGSDIELHCRRLFSRQGNALDLAPVVRGRRIDIVEDTGLREYLPPHVYRSLTAALWQTLAAGGLMSTGNMNANRPQPEFLHGLMGWQPTVRLRLRTIARGFALHEASGDQQGFHDGSRHPRRGLHPVRLPEVVPRASVPADRRGRWNDPGIATLRHVAAHPALSRRTRRAQSTTPTS